MCNSNQKTHEKIIDSSLVIGLFVGVCYALGYMHDRKRSIEYQVPMDFFGSNTIYERVTAGAFYFIVFLSIGIVLFSVGEAVWRKNIIPQSARVIMERFLSDIKRRRFVWGVLLAGLTYVLIINFPFALTIEQRLLGGGRPDRLQPSILRLDLSLDIDLGEREKLKYFAWRDGFIVLRNSETGEFHLVQETSVLHLSFMGGNIR